jgi:putative addiction module component (TIGR02574 family)
LYFGARTILERELAFSKNIHLTNTHPETTGINYQCFSIEGAMNDTVNDLALRGMALSIDERSRLVDLLLESLHEAPIAEVEEAWSLEIERRLTEYHRGDGKSIAAEDVFFKARKIAR